MHTQLRRNIQHSQKYAAFLEERIRLKERKEYSKNMKSLIHQCGSVQSVSAEVSLIKTDVEDEQEVKESQEIEATLKLEDESETENNKESNHKKDIEDIKDIEVKKEIFTENDSDMSTTDETTNFSSINQASQMNFETVTNTPTVILLPPFFINSEVPTPQQKIGTYVTGTCGLGIKLPPGWPPPAKRKPKQPEKSSSRSKKWKKKRQLAQVEVGQVAQVEEGQSAQVEGVQAKVSKSKRKPRKEKYSDAVEKIEIDHSGIFLPLNEYFYGTLEGDLTHQESQEETSFKCCYCCRWGFNNIEMMDHIYKYVDPGYELGFNLLDLAKCKFCLIEFNTPFEMQTHVEKVHTHNLENRLCRICEKEIAYDAYSCHMRSHHNLCEMPYICKLCKFRSSMHSDVVDHFKKKHINSEFLLCYFCLRVFNFGKSLTKGVNGQRRTEFYYQHIARHLNQGKCKKCRFCKLTFTTKGSHEIHRKSDHLPCTKRINELKAKYSTSPVVEECENAGDTDCTLVPAVTKCMDNNLILPPSVSKHKCIECKMLMGIPNHYGTLSQCSLCRFATRCSFAYLRHSHKQTKTISNASSQGRTKEQFHCGCGFVSCHRNLFANHMIVCSKESGCKYVGPASGPGEFDFKKLAIKEEIVEGDELEDVHTGGDANEVNYSYTMTLEGILSEDHIKQEVKQEMMSDFPGDTEGIS